MAALLLRTAPEAHAQSPAPPTPATEGGARVAVKTIPQVTWQQALEQAAARNASVLVAEQEIARADALVREARSSWLPLLYGNGTYTRIDSARTFNGTVTTPSNLWNGNLQLTVPIVSPPAWANDWHAQDGRALAVANRADLQRQLASAVARAYLTVLLQHRQVDVGTHARDNARAHYEYAHTRMTVGLGNGVDDARAEQELRSDEAQLKNAETALLRSQSALAILLAREDLVDAVDDVTLGETASSEGMIDEARRRRPDVQALVTRRASAEHLRRDEWVYYAPSLLAQAQAFKQTQTPLQPGSGWQAALVLSIPFYDGGLRYGVRKERQAVEEEARLQLDALLRQVSVEVRTSLQVVGNADGSLGSARQAVAAATNAATLADRSYRGGASTNIEVVDAERRVRDAESQAALAEDAARQARLDLLLATGAFP